MIPEREQKQLDKLNHDLDVFLQKLGAYPDEQLNRQPGPGVWSPLMVVRHMMLAEDYADQYMRKKLSFTQELPKAGLPARLRSLALNVYLRSPFKWKAPDAIGDQVLEGNYRLGEIKAEWLEQRRRLNELLESFPPHRYREEVYKHPFVGKLSAHGMLSFFQGHFDRHRKQAEARLG